tara:strand:+ start:194 stop:601 length:408 start_codon:yes stop_codon:yes gene_type:complete
MSFWRREDGYEEFIEIARIALGKNKKEDYIEWVNHAHPMHFMKYPVQHKGFETLLKEWLSEVDDKEVRHTHSWWINPRNLTDPEDYLEWKNYYIIEKLNNYLHRNIPYQNGKNSKQTFAHAKDIFIYFQKEANFE